MNRIAIALLGTAMLAGSFRASASAHVTTPPGGHRGQRVWLLPPSRSERCCPLILTNLATDSATVEDSLSRFGATVSRFLLARSRMPGDLLLWVYVVERNQQNIAATLMSGPSNWLLLGARGIKLDAYPGLPRRQAGTPLFHVDGLGADTNPANEGWIWFRIPSRVPARYTLAWDDCRPRCNPTAGRSSFAPVVDVVIGSAPKRHGLTPGAARGM